jgi:plastocyanin
MRMRMMAATLGALLLLAGCGGGTKTEPAGSGVTIRLGDMQFQPTHVEVKVGTTITFINEDGIAHDVVQLTPQQVGKAKPGFESGKIQPGKSWSHRFDKPGTYPILCTQGLHYTAGMVGTVTVTN